MTAARGGKPGRRCVQGEGYQVAVDLASKLPPKKEREKKKR